MVLAVTTIGGGIKNVLRYSVNEEGPTLVSYEHFIAAKKVTLCFYGGDIHFVSINDVIKVELED